MARSRSPWHVRHDRTACEFSFFISHVTNDNDEIRQLKTAVDRSLHRKTDPALKCFFDVDDWEIGRPNLNVIRDKLLNSVHMLAWVTPNYVAQSQRGWVW